VGIGGKLLGGPMASFLADLLCKLGDGRVDLAAHGSRFLAANDQVDDRQILSRSIAIALSVYCYLASSESFAFPDRHVSRPTPEGIYGDVKRHHFWFRYCACT
jgi:hypothetical protein